MIELRDVHQRFGAVTALRGAGLSLRSGEVHALLGENGAGKSTLLRVLAGLQIPDRGELSVRRRVVRLRTPREAWQEGIGLVHQHSRWSLASRCWRTLRSEYAVWVAGGAVD